MKDETSLTPFPSGIESLLEAERARPGPPAEIQSRMYGRLAAALGLPPGPDGPGGASSDPGVPSGDVGPAAGAAGGAGGAAVAAKAAGLGAGGSVASLTKPMATVAAVAFVVGAIAGSVGTHLLNHRQQAGLPTQVATPSVVQSSTKDKHVPRSRDIFAVNPAPAECTDDSESESVENDRSAVPSRIIRRGKLPQQIVPDRQLADRQLTDRQLAAERALVERARSALVRSRIADAMAAVAQHCKTFPDGKLVEEREAIRVLALVADGEHDQARQIGKLFRERYPKSLLLPAVDAALEIRPRQIKDREKPVGLK